MLALAFAFVAAAAFGLAHTGSAAAATTCTFDCPTIFGLAPQTPGDILDTSANLTFFAIGASTPGSDYTWKYVWGLHGGALDQTTPGPDAIAAGSFTSHSAVVTGLSPSTQYDVQVIATGPLGQEVDGPLQTFPTIDPCTAGHCLALSGAFAPNTFANAADISVNVHTGGSATQWRVEWESGAETGFPHVSPWQPIAAGADGFATVHISGLTPSTVYTSRIVATNTASQTAEDDFTFQTLNACSTGTCPSVLSSTTQIVSDTSEKIIGNIATFSLPTQWYVEYGTTASYGSTTPVANLSGAASPDQVTATLAGLAPSTLYHYRLVATNSSGTAVQPDQTFTTDSPCNWGHCPTVTGTSVSAIAPNSATVFGTVGSGTFDTTWTITVWKGTQTPQVAATGVVLGTQSPTVVSAPLLNLTGTTLYNYTLTATSVNGTASSSGTFTTLDPCQYDLCADPRQPSVFGITDSYAYVAGFVGTRNKPTTWTLQISSDGGATWSAYASGTLPGENTEASEFDVTLTGLTQLTVYQVRIIADNGQGPVTGLPASFATDNACTFGKCPVANVIPTLLRATRVILGGTIDTKGSATHWQLKWGTTTAYTGGTIPGDPVPGATGGTSPVDPITITGLHASTIYHYQVIATNGYGTTTGVDQTFTTTAAFVNTDSIAWQYGPNLPKPWSGFTAADLNGTMFVTGNDSQGSIYSFDPYHGQDEFALQAGHAPYVTQEEGSAFLNGKLWLMSTGVPVGSTTVGPQRVTEIYDPVTSTWTIGPVVQNEDTLSLLHPAFVNAGGTLYAFNGRGVPGAGRSHIYDEAWKLSADQAHWLPIAAPPTPVADPGVATGDDGRIYLFGGVACVRGGFDGVSWFADCLQGTVTNITQIYNPTTNTWSLGAPMPTARYSLTAIHAGCALYAIGGLLNKPLEPNSPGNPTNGVTFGPSTATVEVYNFADDRWIAAPSMLQPRADFAAAFVGHQVWVLGGGPETQLSTTEYVTPAVVATAVSAPATPNGLNGWYVTHPTVTLNACDGVGGPATLIYGFDGSTTGHPYTGSPQTVTVAEGQHTLTYGAFDTQHNAAVNTTRAFKVDTIPPTIAFAAFTGGAYTFTVADGGSGVDHVVFTATTPTGTVALGTQTSGFSIPASSLPAGTTAITAVAYDVAGNHTSVTQATGTATQLTLTGATKGVYGHTVTLSATLKSGSTPLAGQTVVLKVGTQSCTATTNSSGVASCNVTLRQTPGSLPLTATFAGTVKYLPASASGTFVLSKASSQLEITTGSCSTKEAQVSAKLVDDQGDPLSGRTITFTVGSVTTTATTNSNGVATTGKLSLAAGKYKATASWPGDTYYTGDSDSGYVTISKPR